MPRASITLVGRSSSHFTRVTRIFALELGLQVTLEVVHDITSSDSRVFAGNPALKVPALKRNGGVLVGTENICRAVAEQANSNKSVVWPEELPDDLSRNAQELVWHAMAAQVQLVLGTVVAKLPDDNVYFVKSKAGLEGSLVWLEQNIDNVLALLPAHRDLSLFEVTLFCLVEHLAFRGTVASERFQALSRFASEYGLRASARETGYRFDSATV